MNNRSTFGVQRKTEELWRLCVKTLGLAMAILFLTGSIDSSAFARSKGKAVLLTINDVYRIDGINDGRDGGLARVRALRAELEQTTPDLLFLYAGDFVSTSLLGRTYSGAQMIDLMNVMDGNFTPGIQDNRMFAAFGNHEFDDTHCGKEGPLQELVSRSEFTYLASNLNFKACKNLSSLANNKNILRNHIIDSGGLRIGLFGLTKAEPTYAAVVTDPVRASCLQVRDLRAQGVDVIVALTHLSWGVDMGLLGLAPNSRSGSPQKLECAPDIIVGGYDHLSLAMPSREPRLFKGDANALSAWVIEIEKSADGPLHVQGRLVHLDEDRAKDPSVQRLADAWLLRHDERFCLRDCIGKSKEKLELCLKAVNGGACLKQPIARVNAVIETEEIANRSLETGFGNWVTDQMRKSGRAQVAFLNAGAIRLNYNLEKGTVITRRHLEEMFPFRSKIVVRDVPGSAIWHAMEHAVKHRGEGAWAHFSGMAVRLTGVKGEQKVQQILLKEPDGSIMEITAGSTQAIRVASLSFVLAGGDGYGIKLCPDNMDVSHCKGHLESNSRWPLVGDQSDLTGFVRHKLSELGVKHSLNFSTDGRLCDPRQRKCLIDSWESNK